MDTRLAAFLLCVGCALSAACADQVTIKQQGHEIQLLTERVKGMEARFTERQGSGTLEQQERCSRQAVAAYRHLEYKEGFGNFYENHFNTKLGKCFIYSVDTKTEKGAEITSYRIADAYEMKEYGNFMSIRGGIPLGEPYCQIRDSNGELAPCTAGRPQFDAFVKRHMTE